VEEKEDRIQQYTILQSMFSDLLTRVDSSARSSAVRFESEFAGLKEALLSETRSRERDDEAFGESVVEALTKIKALALECYGLSQE